MVTTLTDARTLVVSAGRFRRRTNEEEEHVIALLVAIQVNEFATKQHYITWAGQDVKWLPHTGGRLHQLQMSHGGLLHAGAKAARSTMWLVSRVGKRKRR